MRFLRLMIAFSIAVLLAGCAPTTPVKTGISFKRIGVISTIGDTAGYQKIGFTVFQNDYTWGDVTPWQLDGYVVEAVRSKLSPTSEVIPIAVNHAAMNPPAAGLFEPSPPALNERIANALMPAQPEVDAYFVVSGDRTNDFISSSRESLSGLGLFRRQAFGIQIYAVCEVMLVDARTKEALGRAPLRMDHGSPSAGDILLGKRLLAVQRPHPQITGPLLRELARVDDWANLTDAQKDQLKAEFQKILSASLDFTLKDLQLTH